jgi:hypothetical protein
MTSGQSYGSAVLDYHALAVKEFRRARYSNVTRKREEEVCLQDLRVWQD